MKKHLYVGNLSPTVTEDQLRSLFSADGRKVETLTIRKRAKTGKSRGFGFLKMASEEDAAQAVESLNETEIDGRVIKVREAHRDSNERPTVIEFEDKGFRGRPKRRS